jgi:hypothetical protein
MLSKLQRKEQQIFKSHIISHNLTYTRCEIVGASQLQQHPSNIRQQVR